MVQIWNVAIEQLNKGLDFAIAMIVSTGPPPPHPGDRLLVLKDGATAGAIGGGTFEAQVRDLALRAIETRSSHRASFPFCSAGGESAAMNSEGKADVLIEFVDRLDPILDKIFRRLHRITSARAAAYFISEVSISHGEWSPHSIRHALLDAGGFRIGGFPGCLQLIESLRGRNMLKTAQLIELGGWEYPVFLEWMKPAGTVYLFGTGQVGVWVARFASEANFKVVVIEDRPKFTLRENVSDADAWIVTDSLHKAFVDLPVDEDSFLVIVTRGHEHDNTLLAQALLTRARYIGMIGSRRKTGLVFKQLQENGFSEEHLSRVHASIVPDIESENPQQIALSIVAEMVRVRYDKDGTASLEQPRLS